MYTVIQNSVVLVAIFVYSSGLFLQINCSAYKHVAVVNFSITALRLECLEI